MKQLHVAQYINKSFLFLYYLKYLCVFFKETLKFRGENRERLFCCSYAAVESLCVQLNIPKVQGTVPLDKVRQAGKYLLTSLDLNVVSSVFIKTFAVNLSWQFYCWTWGFRDAFKWEQKECFQLPVWMSVWSLQALLLSVSCVRSLWVTLTDYDAFTFFSLFFLFCFSSLQDSKMLNNQPVTFSRFDWSIYVCTLEATLSWTVHSHSQPLPHSSRVRPAVVFAGLPFTSVPAKSTSCIKKKKENSILKANHKSPPLHITKHWNQYKPKGSRHEMHSQNGDVHL